VSQILHTRGVKKSAAIAVYGVVFLDMLGFGVMIPVVRDLTQYLVKTTHLNGRPEIFMGILMASYSGAQMLSAPILGHFSDIWGRKPVFLISAIGNVLSYVIWILTNNYWVFLSGRILSGITGGNIAIAQSIIADHTTPAERPRAMGLLGAAIGMGFVLGPFIGAVLININPDLKFNMIEINPFWFIGLVCLGLAFVAVVMIVLNQFDKSGQGVQHDRKIGVWTLLTSLASEHGKHVYLVQLLSQVSFVSFEVLFAWILQKQYNFDLKDTFYFFGAQGLFLALVQGGIYRRIEHKKPPEAWVRFGLWGSIIGMCLLPWAGYVEGIAIFGISLKIILLCVVLMVLSLALGFGSPSMNAYASIHAPANAQGQTMGNMQALAALARFAAPLMATTLYAAWLPLPFLAGGVLCLIAVLIFNGSKATQAAP